MNRIFSILLLFALSPVGAYPEERISIEQLSEAVPGAGPAAAPAAVPFRLKSQGADLTAAYKTLYADPGGSGDAAIFEKLKNYKVLFVPGFLAEASINPIPLPWGGQRKGKYFDEQMDWLKSIGVDYQRIEMEYEAPIRVNARVVAAAISASVKPVVIIAHSKGGLDSLAALITDSALAAKVRGIVTFQTPYYGSPVADYVIMHRLLGDLAGALLFSMGGTKAAMVNLGTAERDEYLKKNASAIAGITALVPVLTLATWKDREPGKFDIALKPLRDMMLEDGIKSDGVVPVDSAVLPGADFVKLGGLDHSVTVRASRTIPLDRIKLTKALLMMVLSR